MLRNVAVVGIGLAMAAVAGCSSGGGSGDESVVTIGAIEPVSGPNAFVAEETLNGLKLAIKQANDGGDLPNGLELALKVEDDASTPATGVAALKKLVEREGAAAVVGPFNSDVAAAVAPLADRGGTPLVLTGATAQSIMEEGYDTVFRPNIGTADLASEFAGYFAGEGGWKKVAFIYQETDYGEDLVDASAAAFEDAGGEVVNSVSFTPGETDFTSLATRLANSDYDGIMTVALGSEMPALLRQLSQAGVKSNQIAAYSVDPKDLVKTAANDVDGLYTHGFWDVQDPQTDAAARFLTDYEEAYGSQPSLYAAQGYTAGLFVADAVTAAESGDSDKIVEALSSDDLTVAAPFGDLQLSDTHEVTYPMLIQQFKGTELATIAKSSG